MKVSLKNKPQVKATICFICLFIAWEILARVNCIPAYILPPFSQVIATLWQELVHGNLLLMAGRTLLVLSEALGISLFVSLILVFLCQKSKTFRSFYEIVAAIMNSVPSLALLPIIIMWIGIDNVAVIALVMHSVIWTFTIYVMDGINSISKSYREFSDNIGLTSFNKLICVYFPAALPSIVSGLKIAWGRAWRSLIGAEILFGAIGAAGGLGYFININRQIGDMSKVLAGVIIIVTVGLLVEFCIFRKIDRKLKVWGMNNE